MTHISERFFLAKFMFIYKISVFLRKVISGTFSWRRANNIFFSQKARRVLRIQLSLTIIAGDKKEGD